MLVKTHKGPVEVAVGTPFADAISTVARNLGLAQVRVFVNGEEIDQQHAPATITEDMIVGIQPDDVAA